MTTQLQEKAVYALDPAHTTIEFVVRHLMITKVRGRFTAFDGPVELEPDSDVPATVGATIEAGSIDTREDQRDAHLRSADFFDVEKFPTLAFESTRIYGTPDELTIDGKLTIHDVTRDVTLRGSFEGRANDPWGGDARRLQRPHHDQPQGLRPHLERRARDGRRRRGRRGPHRAQRRGDSQAIIASITRLVSSGSRTSIVSVPASFAG